MFAWVLFSLHWPDNDFVHIPDGLQDLIRRCLTYNQADRPDVLTIAQDAYLTYVKR